MKAVVLGGVSWNTMVYVDRFPDPVPQTVFAAGSHTTVGSSGAGKALNLRSLGADVALWGLIGADEDGSRVISDIRSTGIEFTVEIDQDGTPRHINLMDDEGRRISIFANPPSDRLDVDVDVMREAIAQSDLVSITINNHCRPFLELLHPSRRNLWIDIHDYDGVNPHHTEFIEAADYLFMSDVAMADWRPFLESRVEQGLKVGVCTRGADGASGLTADEGWVHVPAKAVDRSVDTNGAGDGFLAGFAVAWLQASDLEASLHAGATQAARVVQSPDLAPRL